MTSKGKRPMRALTPGDKIEAIQRVNDGESKASVARDIGVPESTLRGWCKNEDKLRYMTSRLSSSPDTDKSNDGEPSEKRARTTSRSGSHTASPAASPSSTSAGLDLTASAATAHNNQNVSHGGAPLSISDAPVELTVKRTETSSAPTRQLLMDPDPKVSVAAISPLSAFPHLPYRANLQPPLSFNDMSNLAAFMTNSGITGQQTSRALRNVRSPKPAHHGSNSKRSKNYTADPFRSRPTTNLPDLNKDDLWNWPYHHRLPYDMSFDRNTVQTVLNNLINQSPYNSLLNTNEGNMPKSVTPIAPLNYRHEYATNSKQFYSYKHGGVPVPEDKLRSASQVPKDNTSDNILYMHLIKDKLTEEQGASVGPSHTEAAPNETAHQAATETLRVATPVGSPKVENKKISTKKIVDTHKNPHKARNVLDNLLFNKINPTNNMTADVIPDKELETSEAEALEYGEKFLKWIEECGDPSVTRIVLQQLRTLLHNLRSRRSRIAGAQHTNRRK